MMVLNAKLFGIGATIEDIKFIVTMIICGIISFLLARIDSKKAERWVNKHRKNLHTEYIFSENDFVDITTKGNKTKTRTVTYKTIRFVAESENLFVLYIFRFFGFPVKKSGFQSQEEIEAFRRLIQERIIKNSPEHMENGLPRADLSKK